MTDTICHEVVTTYLKQLRLSRMARDCEPLAREAEQRGLGYLGYLQALLEGELAQRQITVISARAGNVVPRAREHSTRRGTRSGLTGSGASRTGQVPA